MPKTKYVPSKYVRVTVREVTQLRYLMQSVPAALAWQIDADENEAKCRISRPRDLCSEKQFLIFVPPWLCDIETAVGILKVWSEKEDVWIDVEVCPFAQRG